MIIYNAQYDCQKFVVVLNVVDCIVTIVVVVIVVVVI